jgi:hypothetical protein
MKKIIASCLMFVGMTHGMDQMPLEKFIDDSYKIIAVEQHLSGIYSQLRKKSCILVNAVEVSYSSHSIGKLRKGPDRISFSYSLELQSSENKSDQKVFDLSSNARYEREPEVGQPFFVIVEKENDSTDKKVLFIEKSLMVIGRSKSEDISYITIGGALAAVAAGLFILHKSDYLPTSITQLWSSNK